MDYRRDENVVFGYSRRGVVLFHVSLGPDGQLMFEPVKVMPVLVQLPAIA